MSKQLSEKLVKGYMKETFTIWTPNIVISVIISFVNDYNMICCSVSNNHFESKNINNIVQIYVNRNSYFYVTNDNKLYVNGHNDCQQLGIKSDIDPIFELIKHDISNINIVSHGISNYYCYTYTTDHKLYCYGNDLPIKINSSNDQFTSYINTKSLLINYEFKSTLIQIECGSAHSLFLTLNGYVYGVGSNSVGQLSHAINYNNDRIIPIHEVNNITQIGCTFETSFVLNKNNTLYTFGSNSDGLLGNELNIRYSSDLQKFKLNIQYISCGMFHVICLTDKNEIYTWGYNSNGQLGLNSHDTSIHVPSQISLNNIIDIKCGGYHTFFKSNNNVYYGCGSNGNNELLLENIDGNIRSPQKISMEYIMQNIGFKPIIDLIPARDHTLILQKTE